MQIGGGITVSPCSSTGIATPLSGCSDVSRTSAASPSTMTDSQSFLAAVCLAATVSYCLWVPDPSFTSGSHRADEVALANSNCLLVSPRVNQWISCEPCGLCPS